MNDLITIKDNAGQPGVDARELHEFLQVGTRFDIWLNRQIEKYSFLDGQDFCSVLIESTGGRPSTEYTLSLDMAKELAMVENNEQGRKARRYFIEVEKRYKATPAIPNFADPAAAARAWADEYERRVASESRVDRLIHNNRTYTTGQIAKELGLRSAQQLNGLLHEKGIQYKDSKGVWLPYSEYADKGLVQIKQEEREGKIIYHRQWTGVGRDYIIGIMQEVLAHGIN